MRIQDCVLSFKIRHTLFRLSLIYLPPRVVGSVVKDVKDGMSPGEGPFVPSSDMKMPSMQDGGF